MFEWFCVQCFFDGFRTAVAYSLWSPGPSLKVCVPPQLKSTDITRKTDEDTEPTGPEPLGD